MSDLDRIFSRLRDIREELDQGPEVSGERRRLLLSERDRLRSEAEGFADRPARLRRELDGLRAALRRAERGRVNVAAMRSGNSGFGREEWTLRELGRQVDAGLGYDGLRERIRELEAQLRQAEAETDLPGGGTGPGRTP